MGVGAVTVNGVNLTSKADKDQFIVEFQANRLNGMTRFRFKDDHLVVGGSAIDIREQYEMLITDDGVRIFGGRIATLAPTIVGGTIYWEGTAVSFSTLLDERVIEDGQRDATLNRYDDDDVRWIIGFHSELLATSFVSRLRTQVLPTIDYSGMTLRKALNTLAGYTTGPVVWIDQNKETHWTDPASAQVVQNPGWDSGSSSNWALDAAAVVTADVGPGSTGDYALITTGSGSGMKESTQTVTGITGNKRYLFALWMWSSVASKAQVRLDWQDAGSVSQRIDVLTNDATTSTWRVYRAIYTAPASATKVVVRLGGVNNFTGTVRHDNIGLVKETAAWGVDTTPDLTTTFAPYGWQEPRKSVQPVNRVLVRGGEGLHQWREHAASIAYYGKKFEAVLDDERVLTPDGVDSRAAAVFRKYAFPSRSGTYSQTQGGLSAGTWQIVNIRPLNQIGIEWIATLRAFWLGNGKMLYNVVYGEPEEDIGAGAAAAMAAVADGGGGITPGITPSDDGTPPAVPTDFALTTGWKQAPDGTVRPYLLATWTGVSDVDLDAYEVQIDRALDPPTFTASASGSGGALTAGDYNVIVTAVGAVQGETARSTPKTVTVGAGQRLFVNIPALSGAASYKVYASRDGDPKFAQSTTTTGSNVEITPEGSGAVAPSTSTALAFLTPTSVRTKAVSAYTEDVQGGLYYGGRVRAIDHAGNYSAFTGVQTVTAAPDSAAPDIPTGLTAIAGFRLIGLVWERSSAPDLARYEVRWTTDLAGAPDPDGWQIRSLQGTITTIGDLTADAKYYVQVRAIDTSDNVATSASDPTAVSATNNPEAGWSNTGGVNDPYVTATPTLLGSSDIAANSIIASHIAASGIDAGSIKTGTLSIGGVQGNPDFFLVYDTSGNEIGRWDASGLLIVDPAEPSNQMRFLNGVLEFSTDAGATWTTALSGAGLRADAITFGPAPGGHNAIPNSGFELSAYNVPLTKVWTATTDWDDATQQVNLDVSGSELKLTTFTY